MLPSSTRCSARLNSRNWLITQSMLMHSSGPRLPLRNDTCQCLSITVWRYQIVHMRGVCPIGNDQCHFVGCNKFKIAKKKMLVGYRVATGHPKPNTEKSLMEPKSQKLNWMVLVSQFRYHSLVSINLSVNSKFFC